MTDWAPVVGFAIMFVAVPWTAFGIWALARIITRKWP